MGEAFFGDFMGVLGAIGYLSSYAILQFRRDFAKSLSYSVMNLLSAVLVSISLIYSFNLASLIIQISWICISGYGVCKCLQYKGAVRAKVPTKVPVSAKLGGV